MNMLDPVETLKGVGPKTAATLRKAGIKTVGDFFYNLPRDYENYAAPTSIAAVRPGKVVVRGKIAELRTRPSRRRNLSVTEGVIRDATGAIKVVWFNQSYRAKQLTPEREYYFTGNYELRNGRYSLVSPAVAEAGEVEPRGGLSPVYVAHGGLRSQSYRRLVLAARDKFQEIPDLLPSGADAAAGTNLAASGADLAAGRASGAGKAAIPARGELRKTGVGWPAAGARREALFNAHFPENPAQITAAREYLAFEELFELILAARLNRRENERLRAAAVRFEAPKIREFVARLPFKLTNAQRRAAWEIFQDMAKGTPMNRLLQGDVGSGKTMVAALAAYEAILQGKQVALLAPTAILAGQHSAGLTEILAPFGVRTALLTGATKGKAELKRQIAAGEIDLVIGTHALLTDDTEFRELALVIIDEQHRFGVKQRQKLALKSPAGLAPHLLAMTATPIPRSLQLTLFGDLAVSILDELPKGRRPIRTRICAGVEAVETVYPKIRETLASGQQVYWVCKAIEEGSGAGGMAESAAGSEAKTGATEGGAAGMMTEVTSVKKRAAKLKRDFPGVAIEILHGKLKPAEKDVVMERFAAGKTQILVPTTVVEVGVDVPNATLMVIENAENYGLAQLHQLRGRVGRGAAESTCFLLTSGDARPTRRLREMEKSTDGFHLAEVDLQLRGPGEIYGELQHGALDLRIASLSDTRMIARAQKAVEAFLTNPENMVKYEELMAKIGKYQQITTLN